MMQFVRPPIVADINHRKPKQTKRTVPLVYRDVIISLDSVVQKKKSPQEIVEKLKKDRKEAVK